MKLFYKVILKLSHIYWSIFGKPNDYEKFLNNEKKRRFLYTKLKGYVSLGYWPNLKTPESFNEKLIHRRLHSRDPLWPIITDKVAVREWITETGLDQYVNLIPVIDVIEDVEKFDLGNYQQPFIIKAAWASGINVIVKDGEFRGKRYNYSKDNIHQILTNWANEPYAVQRLIWASHKIPRRYIVEKLLTDDEGHPPNDFKFFVFHGKVELIQIISERLIEQKLSHYDKDKNFLNVRRYGKQSSKVDLPNEIDEMIKIAESISKEFKFSRVDLYLHEGSIFFGEITLTPANGFGGFEPIEFDFKLGGRWIYKNSNPNI